MELKNTGLVLEPYKNEDHVLGGKTVGGLDIIKPKPPVVFPDGIGWIDIESPERGEVQANNNFDSFLCTVYNTGGAISDYLKKQYNVDMDFSECIQGVFAGVTPGVGGTIRNAFESFRTQGWLDEQYRKFTKSTTQAQCFAVVSDTLRKLAKGQLEKWDIYYDLIDSSDNVPHSKIIDNLKYSEIVVAGYAWVSYYGNNNGVFYSPTNQANHCFRIGGYIKDGKPSVKMAERFEGRNIDWEKVDLIAIDSYRFNWETNPDNDHTNLNDFLKPLSKDFKIHSAYRVYVLPKKKDLILTIKNMLKDIWGWFETVGSPKGLRCYFVPRDSQGKVKGKQEINFENPVEAIKILYSCLLNEGSIKKTDWGEISKIKDDKFV